VATVLSTQSRGRYRDVWAEPVFRVLFLSRSLGTTADTLRILALSVLIYAATGSALLAALTYGISFLPQLLGGSLLGALTDRMPPRALMTAGYIGEFASAAVLGLARLPVWGALTLVAGVSCLTPVFTGVSSRVLSDRLTGDAYVLGRALSNSASSTSQLLGLGGGGVAVATLGPRHALLISAACHLIAALIVRLRLPDLPAPRDGRTAAGADGAAGADRAAGRGGRRGAASSVLRESWTGNRRLLGDPGVRLLLLAQWLPPMFVTGAEGLIVPYAAGRHFGRGTAGWLLACLPAGIILGSLVLGRLADPAVRERLLVPLVVLLGLPLIAFAVNLPAVADGALLVATGTGFSYGLSVQRRFREIVPFASRGQAFTLLSTGLMTLQGAGPALAGSAAERVPTGSAIALAGMATVVTAVILGLRLDRAEPPPPPPASIGRATPPESGTDFP
jgi:predicted MFS family arabinose efflux permease